MTSAIKAMTGKAFAFRRNVDFMVWIICLIGVQGLAAGMQEASLTPSLYDLPKRLVARLPILLMQLKRE